MKPVIKERVNRSYFARLKKDLLLLLSHLERVKPRRRDNLHVRNIGSEFASLVFMYGE